MSDVILFGEAMALFVAQEHGALENVEHFKRSISGAEVNVSVGLSRLGFDVSFVTRLGNDELGKHITSFLNKEKINTSFIQYDNVYRTGIQLKSKEKKGDAIAPYFRKESAASKIKIDCLADINWKEIKLLHVTGIPLALSNSFKAVIYEAIAQAKINNVFVSFDPNIRLDLWDSSENMKDTILSFAKRCDLFLPGINEVSLLSGLSDKDEMFDWLSDNKIEKVIMKLGPSGSYYMDNGMREIVNGYNVKTVVDTVGAGDGFASGVLSAILDGLNLKEAALRGNAIGAIQVQHWSDNQGLPDRAELIKFMMNGG